VLKLGFFHSLDAFVVTHFICQTNLICFIKLGFKLYLLLVEIALIQLYKAYMHFNLIIKIIFIFVLLLLNQILHNLLLFI